MAAGQLAQILLVLLAALAAALLLTILRVAQEAVLQTKAMLAAHTEVALFMVLAAVVAQGLLAEMAVEITAAPVEQASHQALQGQR